MECGTTSETAVVDGDVQYCPPAYDVPRDSNDGAYVQSFSLDQVEEYKQFFERFGFVVIDGVLNEEECAATLDDIWDYLARRGWLRANAAKGDKAQAKQQQIQRDDPATWNEGWPSLGGSGILGGAVVWTRRAMLNRQNPNIYQVWSQLLGKQELMINQDRYGLFRPSRDHPEWQTGFNLHLDMNPWTYLSSSSSSSSSASLTYRRDIDFFKENNACFNQEDEIHCQGLLNLIDNREEDGGFIIVPGFKHHFAEWAESHRLTLAPRYTERQTFIQLPRGGEIEKRALRVTCRAGSMVVWDQRTLHGSAPNSSDRFRGAQFIKLFPAKQLDATAKEARAKVVGRKVEEANALDDLSELGQKLFGLAAWDE